MWGITFLTTSLSVSFFASFLFYSLPFPSDVLSEWLNTWYQYGWYSVWWYYEWTVENEKISSLFNTSWLASLRTRYYFRLCFSFSCSGYDLTFITKSRTLNYYSFLQMLLLKTKSYKLVLGNCGSSIYC